MYLFNFWTIRLIITTGSIKIKGTEFFVLFIIKYKFWAAIQIPIPSMEEEPIAPRGSAGTIEELK